MNECDENQGAGDPAGAAAYDSGEDGGRSAYPMPRERTNLPNHLPYQLVHVSALLSIGVSRLFQAQFGLGTREWRVLAILGHYGPGSPSDLVGRAAFDKATVSRAVRRLEEQGYVARTPSSKPRRRQLVYLTEKGVELHDRVAPISRLRRQVVESVLTEDERQSLKVILQKLEKQLLWLNQEEGKDQPASAADLAELDAETEDAAGDED